ncbi:MAG: hypothetical protein WBL39_05950 [Terrimicrobiaceae bacterium]
MESYQTWFGEGPELSVLRILGLFDRPADEKALEALLKPPSIPGLTESLTDLSSTEWRTILARLRRARLLAGEDPHNRGQLDAHPLVREYFGEQLRGQQMGAWKECNRRLMRAVLYLTATRGLGAPGAGICYERAEALCRSLNRPLLLYSALSGQWRYSLMTDKLSSTMQIAKRIYSLAQEQDDSTLMIGAYRALAGTLYWSGDFESARQHAMCGVQIWRSGGVQPRVQDVSSPAVVCLYYVALSEWHLGEIASSDATMSEAISLAKALNDMPSLALALWHAAYLAHYQRNLADVERLASDLIELSTRQNFAFFLAGGGVLRGWARAASGDTAEGLSWIEDGMAGFWSAAGISRPFLLALKAEALHLADRTSEALETIKEAEALVERSGARYWFAELHRLRGAFLTAIGADETQIEASFCAAIRIAREHQSISLEKRAEGTYAEYRRQKASGLEGRGVRLPLY